MSELNKVLIVEDESNIARVLQLELEHEGYVTATASDGESALLKIDNGEWSLILLDIMIPVLSGIEVKRVRASGNQTPIILLTARDTIVDKVLGLDQGANDYITKPFEIEELLARIRACLRVQRSISEENETKNTILQLDQLCVNLKTREVKRENESIELTPREYDLLVYLLQNVKQVLTREQILEKVWGFDYYGDTNIVDVYIRYLRNKMDKPFNNPLIHTIRGVGYVIKETKK